MDSLNLACYLEGDYGFKVLQVSQDDTAEAVAAKAANLLGGVVVPEIPDVTTLRVRVQGQESPLPPRTPLRDLGLQDMETIEIYKV